MPLTVNVGISRKASRDYQSAGLSINLTAELDQSLLAKPAELQAQVEQLYAQAEQALDRQASRGTVAPPRNGAHARQDRSPAARTTAEPPGRPARRDLNGHGRGVNGHSGPHVNGHGGAGTNGHAAAHSPATGTPTTPVAPGSGMTASQRRAINAIARRLGLDAQQECRDVLGIELDDAGVRQASQFIDHLKALTNPTHGAPR